MNSQSTARPAAAGKSLKPYAAPTLKRGPVLSAISALPEPASGEN